jgi:protein-ribulosamine 3-kinase
MMEGEYHAMETIYAVTPHFAARPLSWGTFKSNPTLHFFLCDFIPMDDELPELNTFVESLAQLHRESKSPEGKFGFHVTTYNGNLFQDLRWTDTWEECFVNGTRKDFELEREARGPSDELDKLIVPLFEKVIPRLIRPLETNGRSVKPAFVHGDLWHGNSEL